MSTMKMTMAAKDPMSNPEMHSQKESNCWQMTNQLARTLPLCARYTMHGCRYRSAGRQQGQRDGCTWRFTHTHMYVFRYHWSLCIDEQDGLLLRIITASRKIKLAVLRARSES
jgi:hypothetical protein